jgi:hypothetical protein
LVLHCRINVFFDRTIDRNPIIDSIVTGLLNLPDDGLPVET